MKQNSGIEKRWPPPPTWFPRSFSKFDLGPVIQVELLHVNQCWSSKCYGTTVTIPIIQQLSGKQWSAQKHGMKCFSPYGMFPKIVEPQNGWFVMENPIKMDDWGYHYFWKHPYVRQFTLYLLRSQGTFQAKLLAPRKSIPRHDFGQAPWGQ